MSEDFLAKDYLTCGFLDTFALRFDVHLVIRFLFIYVQYPLFV